MDCLVGCASSIAANFVDSTIGVVARRLFPYRRDVDNLTAGIGDLCNARQTVEEKVKKARDEGLVIHDDVEKWLSIAGVISKRAQAFSHSCRDRENISCCTLRIPNLASRRGLSREARQLLEELERSKIEAGSFVSVASRPAMHKGIEIRGDYEHFESRKAILEDIMTALQNRDVTKVGVHGMGGIGKTKLAEEVARRATEAKLFTEVVVTTVSQKPDIRRLQQDIADKMKLKFDGSVGERERADKLLCRLKEEKKKILIILDDIWERLDLLNVGIHFEHEGCKILMTSRYLAALHSMRADKTFKVEDISAEEAMRLFKTIVGGDIIDQPGIATLVNDVVRECGRLPLAITTVASALRCQKDLFVWSNALMQLRISAPTDIDGMLVDVYQSIKLSYDFLNSTEAKSLFLLCSLHGEDEDISVEDLMMISVGQGLFQNVHKLSDARNRVKSLVGKLKDHCLLLDGNDSGTVKMHDVIRDVALYIASESGQDMHCIYTDKVEECLNNRKLKNAKVVSLVQYEFEANQLPEGLGCSHLESLFLVSSVFHDPLAIPKHFLDGKDQLKSLFFESANLVALSPPIHSLQNLQTLCLRGCVLEDVSFIGDLKSLIILDLSHSTIKQLPIEVGQLNRLQLLNLEGCKALELIEPNVISSLKGLEELHIPYRFHKWEVGEITELMDLRQLTSLTLGVPHSKTFPKHFMFRKELEQYRISIGGSMPFDRGIARSLQLKLEERSQLKELGLESLVKRSEALSLDGLAGVKNVVCDLDNEGFSDLKRLEFIRNVSVQYIVNCTADQQIHLRKAFPMLERLRLGKLTNLERICQGKLPQDSFNKLREVDVTNCDKLKNLFPLSIAKRLKKIEVRNCDMMEEVVGHGRENDAHVISDEATHHVVEFLELRSLTLKSLPKFVQFINWSESEATCGSPSVQSPIPLFCEKACNSILFPKLEDLRLAKLPALRNFCVGDCIKFESLSTLTIEHCPQLETFFSCSTPILEVSVDNEEEGRSGKILFPKLRSLRLAKLPALRNFCVGDCIKFESLSTLTIEHCPQLETFFSCSTPILEVSVDNEEEGRSGKILFPKLRSLRLAKLPALRNFCVGECIKFESLSTLTIEHCPQLETFFSCSTPILEVSVDNEEGNHSAITQPLFNEKLEFPSLVNLTLSGINVQILWLDFQFRTTSYMDNLTWLDVSACNNLKCLFIAERLVKLKYLSVRNCEVMEDIVVMKNLEEEGRLGKILFPKLYNLTLDKLPALRNFCVGDCIKFESLSTLTIQHCPQLKTFYSCSTPILEVSVDNEEGNHSAITQPLFNEKLEFPSLEYLFLFRINVQILWLDFQLRTTSYMDNLTRLDVSACNNLKYLFPFFIAERLVKLEYLDVSCCEVMEDIVVMKNFEEEGRFGKILFPKLEDLTLDNLPALRNFCVGDCIKFESLSSLTIKECPQLKTFYSCSTPILEVSVDNEEGNHSAITQPFFNEKLEFPTLEDLTLSRINVQILWLDFQPRTTSYMDNLTCLYVGECNKLKYLFPFFIAERLVKLEELYVSCCEVMEDIVVMNNLEEEGRLGKILFPKLKDLKLENLPALRNFCVGDCIKFESLSRLSIKECPQLKTFYSCSTPILEVSVDNEKGNHSAITQPFFNEKVILPVLEYLETDWSKAMNEQLNMSQSSSTALVLLLSNQLKKLKLNCSTRDKPIALPIFDLLRRCQNLEKLTLKGFFVISAQEYDGQPVANLKRLKLDNVPKLRYLFGESENAQPTNLFACFQNLTILKVSFCHRLTYLLASTIATSLVQLQEMRITDCNRMTTIIEDYRENETTKREHDHEFVFPNLEILELESLPHLESFYSGNTDIRLPKLESLFVSGCPEMRTFSRGNISAPMLHKIIYGWRSQYLDGDVNTTVRKLWEDDSNLTLKQLFTETEVHDSREGTSSRAADYRLLLQPYFKWS